MRYEAGEYDVAIVGAGHAGCEAALACARLSCRTVLFTMNLDFIANMPCNPSIGGTGKGHLVREIDALGGEMGKVADATTIQSRILNRGKGPAVYSLRAQCDRRRYQMEMKHRLEMQENLSLRQAEVVDLLVEEGKVRGVVTHTGAVYRARAVVIATGTFLKGRIVVGDAAYDGGPDGSVPAGRLSDALRTLSVPLRRFKTGTPARINRRQVDFSRMERQDGDVGCEPFSFTSPEEDRNRAVCYLCYTNEKTHAIIRENLHRSPLFSGVIEGVGPRYCPSIEDKVVRFADKDRHQIFIEPMGMDTEELYVQGMSSSLPEDVQVKMLRSIEGLEQVEMMRTAYAIEYDCVDPTALLHTLEFKNIPGLFGCGQFNGSSGYEEAAAQGLVAGINAAHQVLGREPFVLSRTESYIGTLIDDLVIKGTNEPYRMMTARSEYRLLLRQDNADLRLTPKGYEVGLIGEERYQAFLEKRSQVEQEVERLKKTVLPPSEAVNRLLLQQGSTPIQTGAHLCDLLRRPELSYEALAPVDPTRPTLPRAVWQQAEIQIRYDGYIRRQFAMVEQQKKLEGRRLPADIDYLSIHGLRIEARQKLDAVRPASVGQAARISGVSPADVSVLLIYLESLGREH